MLRRSTKKFDMDKVPEIQNLFAQLEELRMEMIENEKD